jgi:hypothetical protein
VGNFIILVAGVVQNTSFLRFHSIMSSFICIIFTVNTQIDLFVVGMVWVVWQLENAVTAKQVLAAQAHCSLVSIQLLSTLVAAQAKHLI